MLQDWHKEYHLPVVAPPPNRLVDWSDMAPVGDVDDGLLIPKQGPPVTSERFRFDKLKWWMRPRSWWMRRFWFNDDYWEYFED
jgi:hypothetical protein